MGKYARIVLFILIAVVLWIALTSVDAGVMGIGIILSVFAFIDIITARFKENERIIWIVVVLVALITGMVGIAIKKTHEATTALEFLFGLISIILAMSYFLVGRKMKLIERNNKEVK